MKCLLFTSAGKNAIIDKYWIDKERKYDIFLCYYGDETNKPLLPFTDYYVERKGAKMQNFYYFWNNPKQKEYNIIKNDLNKPALDIKNYDYYYIVDDDIIISTKAINNMFKIIDDYNLDMIQPAFLPGKSRICHSITRAVPNIFLRYTNFIENNTPFFSKSAIEKCMNIYDPLLVGYGIDYLFIWYLGTEKKDKYAVIDAIKCINPFFDVREIDILQPFDDRIKNWNNIMEKHQIKIWNHTVFKSIPLNIINRTYLP
jgi:hypothetical protein